ncbi:MAG: hypothetical protein ACFFCW_35650 [Candidatus Hodarchaeota archaeon]
MGNLKNLWSKFKGISISGQISIATSVIWGVFVIIVLVLWFWNVDTELTIEARADSLEFEQLEDLSWFSDSIKSNWLALGGMNLTFRTSTVEIRKDGNACFRNEDKITELEIQALPRRESDFEAIIYKTRPDENGFPKEDEDIELNKIHVSKNSKLHVELGEKGARIEFRVSRGFMKGEINTNVFHMVIRAGQVRRKNNKALLCSGYFEITGKSLLKHPLTFKTESSGRVFLINPRPDNGVFLKEHPTRKAINNLRVQISTAIDSDSKRRSYIRYSAINAKVPASDYPLTAGKRISLTSKQNFDINVLIISFQGIEFISETRSDDITLGGRQICPSSLENIPRFWGVMIAIGVFFLDKIFLVVILRQLPEKDKSKEAGDNITRRGIPSK